jgi:hypothetical protein
MIIVMNGKPVFDFSTVYLNFLYKRYKKRKFPKDFLHKNSSHKPSKDSLEIKKYSGRAYTRTSLQRAWLQPEDKFTIHVTVTKPPQSLPLPHTDLINQTQRF